MAHQNIWVECWNSESPLCSIPVTLDSLVPRLIILCVVLCICFGNQIISHTCSRHFNHACDQSPCWRSQSCMPLSMTRSMLSMLSMTRRNMLSVLSMPSMTRSMLRMTRSMLTMFSMLSMTRSMLSMLSMMSMISMFNMLSTTRSMISVLSMTRSLWKATTMNQVIQQSWDSICEHSLIPRPLPPRKSGQVLTVCARA